MKRLIFYWTSVLSITAIAITLALSDLARADVPISALPAGTTLGGTEAIPAVQSAATVKTTPAAINAYVRTQNILSGVSPSIGGAPLSAGSCASNTVTVIGATTSMAAFVSPLTYPGDGATWSAQITAVNTITVRVCATVSVTPVASTYQVRVIS